MVMVAGYKKAVGAESLL